MTAENLFPLLSGLCGVLLGVGAILLLAPGLLPPAVGSALPETWVFPAVLLGVGGSLLLLLAFRGRL